jgi:type III restriction enzyme
MKRRALVYESDVLSRVPWHNLDTTRLAQHWAPDAALAGATGSGHLSIGLELLQGWVPTSQRDLGEEAHTLDHAHVVRSLADLAPNPWLAWAWLQEVHARLMAAGFAPEAVARSSASLIERLRLDVQAERDRLAEAVFMELLQQGRIEFRLRADPADFELPHTEALQTTGQWLPLVRESDGGSMEKSLLEPALRTPDLNDFEVKVAGYLDQQQAVRWWHRNVAKAQLGLGLQGWKRGKVYPDFVFALDTAEGTTRLVLLETKGAHLAGEDTAYKQALLQRLSTAYSDERWKHVGSLELAGGTDQELICDLVFDQAWRGELAQRYFSAVSVAAAD